LEEEAEFDRLAEQRAEERLLRTSISNLSTEELKAMRETSTAKTRRAGPKGTGR
jgi:hypothetical protein